MSTATLKPAGSSPSTPAGSTPTARPAAGAPAAAAAAAPVDTMEDVLSEVAAGMGLGDVLAGEDAQAPAGPADPGAEPEGEDGGEGEGQGAEAGDGEGSPAEGDGEGEGAPEDEGQEPAEGEGEGEGEGAPAAEVPEGVNPDVWNALTAEAQAELGPRLTELVTAQARIGELEQQIGTLQGQQEVIVPDVHPLFLMEDGAKLAEYETRLSQAISWCVKNFDGYEGKGTAEDPTLTKEQVRERYANLLDAQAKLVPMAKQRLGALKTNDAQLPTYAKTVSPVYGALTKPGTKENQIYQAFLRTVPQLKQLPNFKILIGDAMLGEQIRKERLAKATPAGRPAAAPGKPKPTAKPAKVPPKVPTAPVAAPKGGTVTVRKPSKVPSVSRFVANGGDSSALERELIESGMV